MIRGLTDSGALPTLRATMQFAAGRSRLIAHNIANVTTPDFRPIDTDPKAFQAQLGEAIEDRRRRNGGMFGDLELGRGPAAREPDGALRIEASETRDNVLFHDRNNRSLERLLQSQAETSGAFRTASELFRSRASLITAALREQP